MKVKWCNPENYCTLWTWHKKQHLIFSLYMYTLGRVESVWHLGTVMSFLCAGFQEAWLGMACHPLYASGPRQIFRSSSGKHSLLTVESPWLLQGRGMSSHTERERKKACLSAKIGDKESLGFCTGICPEAFLWNFNLLWHLAFSTEVKNRIVWPPNSTEKQCC